MHIYVHTCFSFVLYILLTKSCHIQQTKRIPLRDITMTTSMTTPMNGSTTHVSRVPIMMMMTTRGHHMTILMTHKGQGQSLTLKLGGHVWTVTANRFVVRQLLSRNALCTIIKNLLRCVLFPVFLTRFRRWTWRRSLANYCVRLWRKSVKCACMQMKKRILYSGMSRDYCVINSLFNRCNFTPACVWSSCAKSSCSHYLFIVD